MFKKSLRLKIRCVIWMIRDFTAKADGKSKFK